MKLLAEAALKFLIGLLLVGLLVFLPAGTIAFFQGWLFVASLFIPIVFMGIVLFVKSPDLLKKRLNGREKEKTQKGVVSLSALFFLVGFVLAGIDFRFSILPLPLWVSMAAAVVLLLSYALYAEVLRENAYLSRTVEVQSGQKVIDKGLYSIVRHPMYAATVLLFLSIPLVLGSLLSLIAFLPYPALIVIRIRNEEAILREQLTGYTDYCRKVKYRLIPFVW